MEKNIYVINLTGRDVRLSELLLPTKGEIFVKRKPNELVSTVDGYKFSFRDKTEDELCINFYGYPNLSEVNFDNYVHNMSRCEDDGRKFQQPVFLCLHKFAEKMKHQYVCFIVGDKTNATTLHNCV